MSRRPKSCIEFAAELAAAGAKVRHIDRCTFRARTGSYEHGQEVTVYFYRDVDQFNYADGYGGSLRSMRAVRRHLCLPAAV